jgi:hypothetical protein
MPRAFIISASWRMRFGVVGTRISLPPKLAQIVWASIQLVNHVTVDAAASGVVDDYVALVADECVHFSVNRRVAGCFGIAGSPSMQGGHTGTRVVTADDVLSDFLRRDRKVRVLLLAGHATRRGNGHDDLILTHAFSPRFAACCCAFEGIVEIRWLSE